jgi:hypothetical protein
LIFFDAKAVRATNHSAKAIHENPGSRGGGLCAR